MTPESTISQELQAAAPTLLAYSRDMPYQVPTGYFDQLPATVLSQIANATSSTIMGDVPAGYFDQLPHSVLHRIKQLETEQTSGQADDPLLSPQLTALRNNMPFQVPEGYFGALQTSERLPAGKRMPYAEPNNYFNQLPDQVMARAKESTSVTGRVVTMRQRSLTRWMQAAAAAFIFALAGMGVYQYTQQPTPESLAAQPAKTWDAAIVAGTQMSDVDFENQLKALDPVVVFSYLEKTSTESDLHYLASQVDENKLPNGDELLLDGQALNQFIQELESSSLQP
jgi:hypothetical protein